MLILFVKARAKWDTHTPDLFDAITQVHGYTKQDGTFVQPHSAHRMHAVEPHHVVDVANLSNNGGKPHKEPQMESNAAAKTPGMSRDEAIDFGKRSALEALDQGELYGTVQDTIDTYRDNVRDTLNEKRAADFEQDAFNAFDQVISASKPAPVVAPAPTQEVTVDADGVTHNGVELTARTAVHTRRIGLLTSLVSAYDRANEERVARAKRVNAWVGTVGERREFTTTFAGANSFDTAYGVMFVMRFDSPEGLLVYKGGTPDWAVDANGGKELEAGDEIKFVGTIKEHADYKGTKQTLVSRCAVIKPKPVKVKAAKKLIVRTEALAA